MIQEERSLGFLLVIVGRLHHHRVHQLLDVLGLYHGQSRLMHMLWREDGQSHTDLAGKMEVTPATMTRLVQRAEKSGLVDRRRDSSDQRVSRVFLTDEGWAKKEQVFSAYAQLDAEAFAGFGEDERQQIRTLLDRVKDNLRDATGQE